MNFAEPLYTWLALKKLDVRVGSEASGGTAINRIGGFERYSNAPINGGRCGLKSHSIQAWIGSLKEKAPLIFS